MAPEPSTSSDALGRDLFDAALLRGSFTLRSGAVSDRYFDKYRVSCDPQLLAPVAARLAELVRTHAPGATRILAPALGAVPLAAAVSLQSDLPYAIVRGAAKGYGTSNRIEGVVQAGERAVLIEDVVTSGGAALDAIEVGRAAGLQLQHVLCVLERAGSGRDALSAAGVALTPMYDASQMDAAFAAGLGQESTA